MMGYKKGFDKFMKRQYPHSYLGFEDGEYYSMGVQKMYESFKAGVDMERLSNLTPIKDK